MPRPQRAFEQAQAWVRGESKMMQTRAVGCAARPLSGAPRFVGYAAAQAALEAHIAAHEPGAAAHAITEGRVSAPGRRECERQRDQLTEATRWCSTTSSAGTTFLGARSTAD